MKKNVSMNDIAPFIIETVEKGGTFRLYPKGISMRPLIRQGKDSVLLKSPDTLNKFDIVLYKRENGQYVLHRLLNAEGNIVLCGDNEILPERGVKKEQIFAKVQTVYRKEKPLSKEPWDMKFYIFFIRARRRLRLMWFKTAKTFGRK